MGCTGSKQSRRERRRISSQQCVHDIGSAAAAVRLKGDHVVSLTSSTLGSLRLEYDDAISSSDEELMKSNNDEHCQRQPAELPPEKEQRQLLLQKKKAELMERAKAWSEMIDRLTLTVAPPIQPETINAWELMDGLEELSPKHPPEPEKPSYTATRERREVPTSTGIVRARVRAFQQKIDATRATRAKSGGAAKMAPRWPPEGRGRVVFYFTSLRGVRKTFEDCRTIKFVLRGYGVRVEERDVSMHAGFKAELIDLIGHGYGLPRVFADGNYLGGAEEVRHLHEAGELSKLLEGCEAAPVGRGGAGEMACQVCGDMRFVPCETCSGSCKVYVEEEGEHFCGGFRRCPDCNENGLVRCPLRC